MPTSGTAYVTIGTAARRLGLSPTWTRQLCEDGKLRAIRIAHCWLIDPEDLERLAAERADRRKETVSAA